MKPAFQKDEIFLSEVRRALSERRFRFWWLGQSGFLVVRDGRAMVFDPYLSDSLTRKYAGTDKPHTRVTERVVDPAALGALGVIEVITSSHNHTDHLDAETLGPLLSANPQAKLVIPAANCGFVVERLGREFDQEGHEAESPQKSARGAKSRLVELNDGGSGVVDDMEFHGIAAAHNTIERDAAGRCRFLGYVMRWGGKTLYHSGDTLKHDGLVPALRPFAVDVAFLPINGDRPERRVAGNMDGREAARLAYEIGARLVVPCHYDLFEFNTASPDEFVAECERLGQKRCVLRNGEGLEISNVQ